MYREEYYDYSSKEGKMIKNDLKSLGLHHLTISSLPADFFRMSKSQLEKLFERASDAFIARMYDVPQYQVEKRRGDFGIKQLGCTLNRMERKDETVQVFKEILRIVSNEYNNGNIPHTNSTPLNSEKEFLYMKATGIVRRIDDLGRVVIPKEIRRTMRIREGDPLEIYTDAGGEVIFKKYSPIGELSTFASQYADALLKGTQLAVIICDRDHCVAAAGISKKEVLERRVSAALEDIMNSRRIYTIAGGERHNALDGVDRSICIAAPILSAGDVTGAVVMLSTDSSSTPTETDIKLVQVAAGFLGKQMEE